MPSKKILSICLSLLIVTALTYTVATNLFVTRESTMANEEVENSSLIEQVNPIEREKSVNSEEPVVEYRSIDEPEVHEDLEAGEGHYHEHAEEQVTEVQAVNEKAPDFQLKTLAGETVKLSDLKGKKVFINFWTTWCPPCVEEMPSIQHFHEKYGNQENIVILAVNVTDLEFNAKDVNQFASNYGISFPILLDEKGEVSINYEVLTIPTSVIINEEGTVVEKIIGPVTEEMLVSKLVNQ